MAKVLSLFPLNSPLCNSISLHFLASGETRKQASIAEFASSQRGPVARRECPTQSVCRVGISQLLQVRDAMETSRLDASQGSSLCHWNIQAAAHGCQFLLPRVLHAYLKHTPAQTSTLSLQIHNTYKMYSCIYS